MINGTDRLTEIATLKGAFCDFSLRHCLQTVTFTLAVFMHASCPILVLGIIEVVCCYSYIKQFHKLILQICYSEVTECSSAILLVRSVADEERVRSCHRQR